MKKQYTKNLKTELNSLIDNNYQISIKGLVQGVGFRPFIYKIAKQLDIKGEVENNNNGVSIRVCTPSNLLEQFIHLIKTTAPEASTIKEINIVESNYYKFDSFNIRKSNNHSNEITEVSPDISICKACIHDTNNQSHRIDYPFTNCTNCGPRFSIIKDLPYDRPNTTMEKFTLCKLCASEYQDVNNRRFHAQPIACNHCGPSYKLLIKDKEIQDFATILTEVQQGIDNGKVYAIKGIGGYFLLCDALNSNAVQSIRCIKARDNKPFAILFKSIESIKSYAELNSYEEQQLQSWRRPIVLLRQKQQLPTSINNGLNQIGAMLPYMPIHYQIFNKLQTPALILTSGNLKSKPIIIDDDIAIKEFFNKVEGIITYNRTIHNRVDDSVISLINNVPQLLRRSRGYAPSPIILDITTEGIFATGAELANSFCIGKGKQALLSQYIGDLKTTDTFDFYNETFHRFKKLFRFKPTLIVTDKHPDYLSTIFGENMAAEMKIPIISAQHHHAHIASVMASNNIDEDVIGISFDGIGLGEDNQIWGAEFYKANYISYERLIHFKAMPLPGGDKASKEPWRNALAYIHNTYKENIKELNLPLFETIGVEKINSLIQIIKRDINCPKASSAGRLFDAVAAIIGLCYHNTYQAEAPMKLEALVNSKIEESYPYKLIESAICFNETIRGIINDLGENMSTEIISTKFHNTIIKVVVEQAQKLAGEYDIKKIVLSGGTFQNRYLTEQIVNKLNSKGLIAVLPKDVPINDQGIALGQLAVAAKKRQMGLI